MSAYDDVRAFLLARDRALVTLDLEWARKQAAEVCARTGIPMPSERGMLGALHNARYRCKTIDSALRHDSSRWLHANMPGIKGLLPLGQLPE